jgi:hypothetical protein
VCEAVDDEELTIEPEPELDECVYVCDEPVDELEDKTDGNKPDELDDDEDEDDKIGSGGVLEKIHSFNC